MDYQWKKVEGFLKKLGFLAEARKLIAEDTDLSKGQLVEVIGEVLEPHNLLKVVGNSRLIPMHKSSAYRRNHEIILARFGIGYLGNTSFGSIGDKFKVSGTLANGICRRLERYIFPMEKTNNRPSPRGFMSDEQSEERFQKLYTDPIKQDIYHRCLEKVCEDPNDVQPDWVEN